MSGLAWPQFGEPIPSALRLYKITQLLQHPTKQKPPREEGVLNQLARN
jgi:hypothetical protein